MNYNTNKKAKLNCYNTEALNSYIASFIRFVQKMNLKLKLRITKSL